MLKIDTIGVRADGKILAPFTNEQRPDGPAAFVLALDPGSSTFINLLPLKADGAAFGQTIGINWNPARHGYRLTGPGVTYD